PHHPRARRVACAVLRGPHDRPHRLWHRRRHPGARPQPRAAGELHLRLSLAPARCGRIPRPARQSPGASGDVLVCELFQPMAYALGMDEPFWSSVRRPLRAPLLHGRLARLENSVTDAATLTYDVLVIGAGGAGLRAAIAA